MAIAYISEQIVATGATVTIPNGTTMAVGLCSLRTGITTPKLNGVDMSIGAVSSDLVGLYYINSPVAGTYTLSGGGNGTYFAYFSGTNGIRAGAFASNAVVSPLTTSISTSQDDVVIGIAIEISENQSGANSLKLDNADFTVIGYTGQGRKQASGDTGLIEVVFSTGGITLYYAFMSIKSLVASDSSTFMTMII
jgi:hypothetical protein